MIELVRSPLGSTLLAAMVVMAGVAGAAAVFDVDLGVGPMRLPAFGAPAEPPAGTVVPVAIGGEGLAVPADMIRFRDQRRGGTRTRLDLALRFPDMVPAGLDIAATVAADGDDDPLVFASVEPAQGSPGTTARVSTVYRRLFTGPAMEGPAGLVSQRLKAEAGYGEELLLHEPGAVRPFAARCFAAGPSGEIDTCLREIHFGRDLMLSYRFRIGQLARWRDLDESMSALAESFLAAPGAASAGEAARTGDGPAAGGPVVPAAALRAPAG